MTDSSDDIDAAIRAHAWMDFSIVSASPVAVVVHGTLDEAVEIALTFEDAEYLEAPLSWRTDTAQPVFSEVSGDEARTRNLRYGSTHGHRLFRFTCEDEGFAYISARWVRLTQRAASPRAT